MHNYLVKIVTAPETDRYIKLKFLGLHLVKEKNGAKKSNSIFSGYADKKNEKRENLWTTPFHEQQTHPSAC